MDKPIDKPMEEQETDAGPRYERKDIHLRWFLAILVAAVCFVAVETFVIWKFYWAEESAQEAAKGSTKELASPLPPEPRLEQLDRLAGVEGSNIDKRLAAQEKKLNSYGPTAEKGFVHVPIQQAIDAVADTLPVRKQPPSKTANNRGPIAAGQSNSGRAIGEEAR